RPGASKRRGEFAADQAGFSHARHHYFAGTASEQFYGSQKIVIEPLDDRNNPVRFDPQNVSGALENPSAIHPLNSFTVASSRLTTLSRFSKSLNGRELGPSLKARSGSSWTSMKSASIPAATPARAKAGMYFRSPPEAAPRPPGNCRLWVASNTT